MLLVNCHVDQMLIIMLDEQCIVGNCLLQHEKNIIIMLEEQYILGNYLPYAA